MNTDELIAAMQADELGDAKFITPVNYAKIRPVRSPQVYQWIRSRALPRYTCQCGRTVILIEEADTLMRAKGKLPPKEQPNVAAD